MRHRKIRRESPAHARSQTSDLRDLKPKVRARGEGLMRYLEPACARAVATHLMPVARHAYAPACHPPRPHAFSTHPSSLP